MGDENRSITISGGTFTGTNIASGDVTVVRDSPRATVGSLREEIRRHRAEIVELAGDKGEPAGRALDDLDGELADPEPDKEIVRGRWKSVLKLLSDGAAAATSVSTIAGMVTTLTGP